MRKCIGKQFTTFRDSWTPLCLNPLDFIAEMMEQEKNMELTGNGAGVGRDGIVYEVLNSSFPNKFVIKRAEKGSSMHPLPPSVCKDCKCALLHPGLLLNLLSLCLGQPLQRNAADTTSGLLRSTF